MGLLILIAIVSGLFLTYQAYKIGIKKEIDLIPAMKNEQRKKKVKNIDKITKDYSNILNLMALGCFGGAILIFLIGKIGMYLGIIVVISCSFMLSGFNSNVDEKIKNKVY